MVIKYIPPHKRVSESPQLKRIPSNKDTMMKNTATKDNCNSKRFNSWKHAERLAYEHSRDSNDALEQGDIWKLDLHGLRASEAVCAVRDRLETVEVVRSPKRDDPQTLHYGPSVLKVITGAGNHSPGGKPVLPRVVKGFLDENRYNYYDVRPGVIAVHPKFM